MSRSSGGVCLPPSRRMPKAPKRSRRASVAADEMPESAHLCARAAIHGLCLQWQAFGVIDGPPTACRTGLGLEASAHGRKPSAEARPSTRHGAPASSRTRTATSRKT